MNCEKCIHISVCLFYPKRGNERKSRDFFKDKDKFIELPCKVGDTVYFIGGIHNTLVKTAKVEEIYYNGDSFALRLYSSNGIYFDVQIHEIFFTREEAEKALKGVIKP